MAIRVSAISWVIIMVLFAGIGFAAYKIGTIVPKNQYIEEIKEYRENARLVVKTYSDSMNTLAQMYSDSNKVYQETIESGKKEISRLTAKANGLNIRNRELIYELRVAIDSAPPVCDPVVEACRQTVLGLQREIVTKDSIIVEVEKRDTIRQNQIRVIQLSEKLQLQRADSLDRVILNMPKIKSKPELFGLIKITPTNSFLAGAITGLTLALIVK